MDFDNERVAYIEKLFLDHYSSLRKACIRYMRYDPIFLPLVDDCIQETFIKAFKSYEVLKTHPNVAGWLVITSKNYLMSELRKHKRRDERLTCLMDTAEFTGDHGTRDFERWVSQNELQDMIDKVCEVLSPKPV